MLAGEVILVSMCFLGDVGHTEVVSLVCIFYSFRLCITMCTLCQINARHTHEWERGRVLSSTKAKKLGIVDMVHFYHEGKFGDVPLSLPPGLSSTEISCARVKLTKITLDRSPFSFCSSASKCDFSSVFHWEIKKLTFFMKEKSYQTCLSKTHLWILDFFGWG